MPNMTAVEPLADPVDETYYPASDGRPMADNELHAECIAYLFDAVRSHLADRPNVFVANNILWYHERGNPGARINPDVLVAFGTPVGNPRRSYREWEAGVAPQVVFEVQSPDNNDYDELDLSEKYGLYIEYGVEEYVVYRPCYGRFPDWPRMPNTSAVHGFRRSAEGVVVPVRDLIGTRSPRLGLTYAWDDDGLLLLVDDAGEPLLDYVKTARAAEVARAQAEAARADAAAARRDLDRLRAAGVDVDAVLRGTDRA